MRINFSRVFEEKKNYNNKLIMCLIKSNNLKITHITKELFLKINLIKKKIYKTIIQIIFITQLFVTSYC